MATDTKQGPTRYPALIFIDGARLRQLRQGHGMNQTKLGKLVELDGSYIGHLERGTRRSCSPAAFKRLCDVLGVSDRSELLDSAPTESER